MSNSFFSKIFVIVLWILFLWIWVFYINLNKENTPSIVIKNDKYKLQLAITNEQQQQGLMNVSSLPKDQWMLFVFPKSDYYSFWMKNTLIPLDMIWIDENYKIVDIQSALPCKQVDCPHYNPFYKAKYVLEINWWLSNKNNYKVGDSVKLVINNK